MRSEVNGSRHFLFLSLYASTQTNVDVILLAYTSLSFTIVQIAFEKRHFDFLVHSCTYRQNFLNMKNASFLEKNLEKKEKEKLTFEMFFVREFLFFLLFISFLERKRKRVSECKCVCVCL